MCLWGVDMSQEKQILYTIIEVSLFCLVVYGFMQILIVIGESTPRDYVKVGNTLYPTSGKAARYCYSGFLQDFNGAPIPDSNGDRQACTNVSIKDEDLINYK